MIVEHTIDTVAFMDLFIETVAKIPEINNDLTRVLRSNPSDITMFPCCVIETLQPSISNKRNSIRLRLPIAVWADDPALADKMFDHVQQAMWRINFIAKSTMPDYTDTTFGKERRGGYFEARFNALDGSIEQTVNP